MRSGAPTAESVDVLLLDGQQRQTLACARALDRAGLRIGVGVCAEDVAFAPAMHSRRVNARTVLPDIANMDLFADALVALLDRQPTRVVLPAHDGTIEAIRRRRADVERRAALALADERALDIAVSKTRTMRLAEELGITTPRTIEVGASDVEAGVREVGLPVVVKPVRSWAERDGVGRRLTSTLARSVEEARRAADDDFAAGGEVILQQWLSGRRDAVSLFIAQGTLWARFAQMSHREYPALGGGTVLCESIAALDDIVGPAERLVRAMGLEGPAMAEFRRDAVGRPVLMEVNPRMGGSVALAVRSGVDLPRLTFAWAAGEPLWRTTTYRVGRRVRWLSTDVWNLKTSFEFSQGPDVPGRLRAVGRSILDVAVRSSALEPFDAFDPLPALVDLGSNVAGPARRRFKRILARGDGGRQTQIVNS